jgi:glycosyltransferase involved in cell wall biosynthesis/MoaA/NifB/PqqE/SkfB family radical SAM enzyme
MERAMIKSKCTSEQADYDSLFTGPRSIITFPAKECSVPEHIVIAYLKKGRCDEARDKFCEALYTGRIDGEQAYQMVRDFGEYYVKQGQCPEMEKVLDAFLASRDISEQNKVVAIRYFGAVYLDYEKYDEAESLYSKMFPLDNLENISKYRLLLGLSDVYTKSGREAQAKEVLDKMLLVQNVLEEENTEKFYEGLCTCIDRADGKEAQQMLKSIAEYYGGQCRYAEMEEKLDGILASQNVSEQNKVYAVRQFVGIYTGREMYKEAERLYSKMLPLDNLENTSKDKLLLGLGDLYIKLGRFSEAREVLNKALELESIIEAEKSCAKPNLTDISCCDTETVVIPKQNNRIEKTVCRPEKPRFSHLVLDYTRLCNSRCTYCGIWKTKGEPELGLDAIERTFSSLKAFGLATCYVTGGEPYISDKVVDIARIMHQYLPECTLSGATNGIQPRQIMRRMQKILRIGVPLRVSLSINGTEATHDATRGRPGFWKDVVYLLEALRSAGVPVAAAMSLMPQTIADLPYMQQFCAERKINLIYSWVRQSPRYGTVDKYYSFWPEELKPRLRQIEYLPDVFSCPGLSMRLVITSDGSVYPCEVYHPEILLGNVNEESLEAILNSPRTASIMRMISNKGCYWCQGSGENDGSPKWMLMDCYRRHSPQAAYLAQNYPQAVHMSPQQSKQVIDGILSNKSFCQISLPDTQKKQQMTKENNDIQKPRISVVICTHRNPNLLKKALESLAQQGLRNELYEVIVVDNNSNDNTKEVVEAYPSVKYVFEQRIGLSYARNAGIEKARADIIAFIDDDAEASPDWLKALLDIYDNLPDAWAVGGQVLPIWDAQKPEWLTNDYYRSLSLVEWGQDARPLQWPERIIGTNCSFRRQVFTDIGYFDTDLGRIGSAMLGNEDTEIQQRIQSLGRLVYYTPDAIVHHHVPAWRMTRQYFQTRIEGTRLSQTIMSLRSQGRNEQIRQITRDIRDKIVSPADVKNILLQHSNPQVHTPQLTKSQRIDLLYERIRENSKKLLMQYKDRYRRRRCVIIGNGPSLNKTDLSLLKNEYTFGLNKIYLLFDRIDWRPTFYVSMNTFVIEQSAQQILNHIPGLKFLDFVSFKYLPFRQDIVYLLSLNGSAFSTDICQGIFQSHTVTYVAMQLAYHLGFDEVFLIGVDHFYSAKSKGIPNEVVIQNEPDTDHFDPNYFARGQNWHLPDLKGSEEGYRIAKQVYENSGRKIYDATIDGRLTIFEKVRFYDVFRKKSSCITFATSNR